MNIHSEKINLIERITHIDDVAIISQLKELLGTSANPVVGYDIDGKPVTKSALTKSLKDAKKRFKAGKFITQDALETASKKW
jgi:hypothetical protein